MRRVTLLIAAFMVLLPACKAAVDKPRVVVMTDIGGDPDDRQSMVRFLLYTCDFDVEGLCTTNAAFSSGNIISDSPERIALRELYIHSVPVRERCIPKPEKCLFAVFNNLLDRGLAGKLQPDPDVATDYFF